MRWLQNRAVTGGMTANPQIYKEMVDDEEDRLIFDRWENDIYSVARVYPSELMTDKDRLLADRDGLVLQQVSLENMSRKLISQRSYRDYYRIESRFAVSGR